MTMGIPFRLKLMALKWHLTHHSSIIVISTQKNVFFSDWALSQTSIILVSVTDSIEITGRSGKNTLQSETRIELGAQSQLLAVAGSTVQIYYEITNMRTIPTFHNFQVVDELRFLQTLNPPSYVCSISQTFARRNFMKSFCLRRMWLPPGQTSSAVLTCIIPPQTEIGAKDKITFVSQALSAESQAAILTVISPASQGLVRTTPINQTRTKLIKMCILHRIDDHR